MNMGTDGAVILAAAKKCAAIAIRRYGLRVSQEDRDDLIAHVYECVLSARARGIRSGRNAYNLYARDGIRELYGDRRYPSSWARPNPVATLPEVAVHRDELHGLRLARLQAIWPTLTPLQRATVAGYAMGYTPTEIAANIGSTMGAVAATLHTATARLDSPKSFSRAASRQGFRRVFGGEYVPLSEATR